MQYSIIENEIQTQDIPINLMIELDDNKSYNPVDITSNKTFNLNRVGILNQKSFSIRINLISGQISFTTDFVSFVDGQKSVDNITDTGQYMIYGYYEKSIDKVIINVPGVDQQQTAPPDITAPDILTATVEDTTKSVIDVVFSEDVTLTNIGYALSFTSGTPKAITGITGTGSTRAIQLDGDIQFGDVFNIVYTEATGDTADLASNVMLDQNIVVQNNVVAPPSSAPVVTNIDIFNYNARIINIKYDKNLNEASIPDLTDYACEVNSSPVTNTNIQVIGDSVLVWIDSEVVNTDTITISYAKSVDINKRIKDLLGEEADNFSNSAVTNQVTTHPIVGLSPYAYHDSVGHPSTVTVTTKVDSVADLGTGGNNLVPVGGSQPTLDTESNLNFAGSNEALKFDSILNFNFLHDDSTPFTIGIVIELDASCEGDLVRIVGNIINSNATKGFRIDYDDRDGIRDQALQVRATNGTGAVYTLLMQNIMVVNQKLFILVEYAGKAASGDDLNVDLNKASVGSIAEITGTFGTGDADATLTIAPSANTSFKLSEKFYFKSLLTAQQKIDIETYITQKYGV